MPECAPVREASGTLHVIEFHGKKTSNVLRRIFPAPSARHTNTFQSRTPYTYLRHVNIRYSAHICDMANINANDVTSKRECFERVSSRNDKTTSFSECQVSATYCEYSFPKVFQKIFLFIYTNNK